MAERIGKLLKTYDIPPRYLNDYIGILSHGNTGRKVRPG